MTSPPSRPSLNEEIASLAGERGELRRGRRHGLVDSKIRTGPGWRRRRGGKDGSSPAPLRRDPGRVIWGLRPDAGGDVYGGYGPRTSPDDFIEPITAA
jgi:hypothetical protein